MTVRLVKRSSLRVVGLLTALACISCHIVASFSFHPVVTSPRASSRPILTKSNTIRRDSHNKSHLFNSADESENSRRLNQISLAHQRALLTSLTALTLFVSPLLPAAVNAYEESDYASETVTNVVTQLKERAGDVDGTFATLEEVAKIITEGKGVGGSLSYDGVKLNEGYVADEDTTIYNPGLTLLTSSEKERLVSAIIENRKIGLSSNHWSENNEYAFDFLKQKLDPLHMYELQGYLSILPFYGAVVYLVALFAQQNMRGVFPLVYGACALAVFGPVILLVANGP